MEEPIAHARNFDRKEHTSNNEHIIKTIIEKCASGWASSPRNDFRRERIHRRVATAAQPSRSIISSGRQLPNGEWAD